MTTHELDDLVGIAEIAAALHVPRYRLKRWIQRRDSTDCPRPLKTLKGGALYSLREWRAWHRLWVATRGI